MYNYRANLPRSSDANYAKAVVIYLGNMANPSTTCIFNIPHINKVQWKRPCSALHRYTNDIQVHKDITITEHKSGVTNSTITSL